VAEAQPAARTPDVSILTSGHDVADARLHREVAALQRAGLSVEVLGLGDPGGAPPGAAVRTWPRATSFARAVRALTLPWRARGRVLLTLDPDAAIGAWLRTALSFGRRRLVADVHEDYALVLRDREWAMGARALLGRWVALLGQWSARHAHLTVVADDHLMPEVTRRVVLRNLPDAAMLPAPSARAGEPRAVYVGDLRASRGLFAMLDAIEGAPGWTLDLVGPMTPDATQAFAARTSGALGRRVRWHGRLDPRQAWAVAEGAWAGLLLLEDTPAFRMAMPSKLYEYLVSGLAVVTTDLPRPAELVRATGSGEVVTSGAQAAAVLRAWSEDPERLDQQRARALEAGAQFTGPENLEGFVSGVRSLLPR
jgi:glycosyltransferase involved in cell wall biosynthesis